MQMQLIQCHPNGIFKTSSLVTADPNHMIPTTSLTNNALNEETSVPAERHGYFVGDLRFKSNAASWTSESAHSARSTKDDGRLPASAKAFKTIAIE